ncbi:hypothetical protein D3C71_1473540 [compost metagenome]
MRHRFAGLADGCGQALDGVTGLAGDLPTLAGQAIGLLGSVGGALDMVGHLLSGGRHLVDGGGHLLGLHALAFQPRRAFVSQCIGLTCLFTEVLGAVLQARQASLHARVLAEHGHFQAGLHATAVGVHLRDQRVGRGLLGQTQQALEAALLPAQAEQAQGYRQAGGQGEAPGVAQPVADQEAHLADQDERQPVLQHRQPGVTARDCGLALIEALIQGFGATDLLGGGFDPHRFEAGHLVIVENRRDVGIDPIVIAGLAAVLDDTHPRQALLEGLPHMGEHR